LIKYEADGSRPVLNEQATRAIIGIGDRDDSIRHTVIIAVSGPAGCGKSTFQNNIIRCLLPDGQEFIGFEAGDMRDSVTEGIDMFDGALFLRDPEDPNKSLNVILLDMQGSGIEVTGVLAEITRLNIFVSTISTVVLHFTRSNSIQQTDVRGWARDLYLLNAINAALEERGVVTTQQAEPIVVVRARAVNLPSPESTPDLSQRVEGPLCVNTPSGPVNFGTDATGYVCKMLFDGAEDGLESDRNRIITAFGEEFSGLLFPITANPARDLSVLGRCFVDPVTQTVQVPAPADAPTEARNFVARFSHYALAPLFRTVWAAHRRRLAATGGDESRPRPGWGTAVVAVLRQLLPQLTGDWAEHVMVNSLVDVVLEAQLNTLADEALGRLSQTLLRILEALMAGGYRAQREQAERAADVMDDGEGPSNTQRLRDCAARLTAAAQELVAVWQRQSTAAMAEAADPFTSAAIGEGMRGAVPQPTLQRVRARYTEDARVLVLETTAELMRCTDEALRQASERLATSSASDAECAAQLEQTRREVEERTRQVQAEVAALEQRMRQAIQTASEASRSAAKKSRGGLLKTVAAVAVVAVVAL
jgi:hypothetical protein